MHNMFTFSIFSAIIMKKNFKGRYTDMEEKEFKASANEKVRIMIERSQTNSSQLSRLMGYCPNNISTKLRRENLKLKDAEQIADLCGYEIQFVKKNNE